MKRSLFFAALLSLTTVSLLTANTLVATFGWAEITHNFGKISRGKPVAADFSFTNTGGQPLVINSAKGSCGCTNVDYPKVAILPGQKGEIKATFNAASVGAFNKTVTVESNAEGGTVVLSFNGEVTE
ncbi:MAG: DUF1573 domain-containing protein [Bacteroidetes bacterium]|nr:DUF1573 domain-containing protein [Fibrella sp.]